MVSSVLDVRFFIESRFYSHGPRLAEVYGCRHLAFVASGVILMVPGLPGYSDVGTLPCPGSLLCCLRVVFSICGEVVSVSRASRDVYTHVVRSLADARSLHSTCELCSCAIC